jgi:hypothetical protein
MRIREGPHGYNVTCFCKTFLLLRCDDPADHGRLCPDELINHWNREGGLAAHILYHLMTKGEL